LERFTLFGNRTTTQAGAMFTFANDFFDHYSAEAMYLRMNGLLPPTAPQDSRLPLRIVPSRRIGHA
jgi:hypothetical protein